MKKVLFNVSEMIKNNLCERWKNISQIIEDADIHEEFDLVFKDVNETYNTTMNIFNKLKENSKQSEFEEFFEKSLLCDESIGKVE